MPKLGLDELIFPMLMEKERERKTEARKQARQTEFAKAMRVLTNPNASQEQKISAASALSAGGNAVPMSMLQAAPKPPNLKTILGVDVPAIQAEVTAGRLTLTQALGLASDMGYKPKRDNAALLEQFKGNPELQQTFGSFEAFKGFHDLSQEYGAAMASKMSGLDAGTEDKPSAQVEKQGMIEELIGGRSYEEVKADPVVVAQLDALGVSPETAFSVDTKAISQARKDIEAEVLGKFILAGGQGTPELFLPRWQAGEDIGEQLQAVYDQYYDKATGKLKDALLNDRVEADKAMSVKKATKPKRKKPADFPGTQDDYEEWLRSRGN